MKTVMPLIAFMLAIAACGKKPTAANTSDVKAVALRTNLEKAGQDAFQAIKEETSQTIQANDLEVDLSKQTKVGEAAVGAAKLTPARAKEDKLNEATELKLKLLSDLEKEFKGTKPTVKDLRRLFVFDDLKKFRFYSMRLASEIFLDDKYEGYSSPVHQKLFDERLRMMKISLEDVRKGEYESGVLTQVEADRITRTEESKKKYTEIQKRIDAVLKIGR